MRPLLDHARNFLTISLGLVELRGRQSCLLAALMSSVAGFGDLSVSRGHCVENARRDSSGASGDLLGYHRVAAAVGVCEPRQGREAAALSIPLTCRGYLPGA